MPEPIPWPALLRAALSMGLPPREFWRLGVREWLALTRQAQASGLDRAGFERLRRLYPDELEKP